MAKAIMVQGTASSAGKSLAVAGLCRIFRQDGFSVAPFKSQNMALNSYITKDGLEMGRAQVSQAEAAGIEPSVLMNPILLKPTGDSVSQVIVNGELIGNMPAAEYYQRKHELIPAIHKAYQTLTNAYDLIIIEGAGSPAEINLMENDIVNMGMAAMADSPVLLVGDIDRGGVFASVYGTVELLPPEDRKRIKGIIINKFRGDVEILRPGLVHLEALTGIPVVGVVPWLSLDLDDEDSLSSRLSQKSTVKALDIAIVKLPRIANFTDFNALERQPAMGVRYVAKVQDLGTPDLLIIPGTKNTMGDLVWLRENGLEQAIHKLVKAGTPLIGVCGGLQILGDFLSDPEGIENGGELRGMGLLPITTRFEQSKIRTRVQGKVAPVEGFFSCLSGAEFDGYEIHMGQSQRDFSASPFATLSEAGNTKHDGAVAGNVLGSYVHGLFDNGVLAARIADKLLADKDFSSPGSGDHAVDHRQYKEQQYDKLANSLRSALDIKALYRIIGF